MDLTAILQLPSQQQHAAAAAAADIKPRKRRTIFAENVVVALNAEFKVDPSPSNDRLLEIASKVGSIQKFFGR